MKMSEKLKIVNCLLSLRLVERCDVCQYCGEPFKECDTLYSDGRFEIGEIDVIGFKEFYYHVGCLMEYFEGNSIYPELVEQICGILDYGYDEQNSNPDTPYSLNEALDSQ